MNGSTKFVLVHGAGHGSWCWQPMIGHLDGDALAVDLPGRGSRPGDVRTATISSFADAVVADVDDTGWDDVVLVGHSLAGLVVPQVASRLGDRVRLVVLIAAAVAPDGGTLLDDLPWPMRVTARRAVRRWPSAGFSARAARWMFCNDMDDEQTRFVLDRLVPDAAHLVVEPVPRPRLPDGLRLAYVKLLRDRCVRPRQADRMVANLGDAEVVTLDAGHDAMVSRPRELAAILNRLSAVS